MSTLSDIPYDEHRLVVIVALGFFALGAAVVPRRRIRVSDGARRSSEASPPQAAGNGFRAFWRFGPPEKPDAVTRMDFVVWDGERASVLYAFVNRPDDG